MDQRIITGNLGADPEMNYTPSGLAVTKMRIAVTYWNSQTKSRDTRWVNVTCFDKLAERCSTWLVKGKKVLIVGEHQERQYTDKNGVVRFSIGILAKEVEFISPVDKSTTSRAETRGPLPDDMTTYEEGSDPMGELAETPF